MQVGPYIHCTYIVTDVLKFRICLNSGHIDIQVSNLETIPMKF